MTASAISLPGDWKEIDREANTGTPAYHNPNRENTPYIKPYLRIEGGYAIYAYPEGVDTGEYIHIGDVDDLEKTQSLAIQWINEYYSE